MSEHGFDVLTRQAAGAISRRRSLLRLGGAALAATLAAPVAASAKRGRKGNGNGGNRNQCKSLKEQCRKGVAEVCTAVYSEEGAGECIFFLTPCCGKADGCDIGEAFTCVAEVLAPPKEV